MHQRHVIYACYFVKSVCMESAPERQAALYSVARNSIIIFFIYFFPPIGAMDRGNWSSQQETSAKMEIATSRVLWGFR